MRLNKIREMENNYRVRRFKLETLNFEYFIEYTSETVKSKYSQLYLKTNYYN